MTLFWILLATAIILLSFVIWRLRQRRLPRSKMVQYRQQWEAAVAFPDPARRVLETEKVLDGILSSFGYEGSLADKLRRGGARLPDIEAIWAAHKLRNRIAHEPGITVTEKEAQLAVGAFARVIRRFIA
ncbi:MAG TPA: hypothetical protein VI913_05000 [Candidatus Peribacteraceae bacterium]|nr:hypothetical protein [Candidatus Peribacteraceae bacterium]